MIVTVTLNPSLDRTVEVAGLTRGAVHRTEAFHEQAGGKGVNVARVLSANGHKARAVLPTGGADGALVTALLSGAGIDLVTVAIAEAVPTNISVVEADGTVTKLNTAGPTLRAHEVEALLRATVDAASAATWVACSGGSPVGTIRSPVGAGDATLAGFLAGGGHGPEALAEALAWGAAAVGLPGTCMPGPEQIDRSVVRITDAPDLSRPIPEGADRA